MVYTLVKFGWALRSWSLVEERRVQGMNYRMSYRGVVVVYTILGDLVLFWVILGSMSYLLFLVDIKHFELSCWLFLLGSNNNC